MNQLTILSNNILTMSSREVAALCEKRHDHVLRDIENLNATYAQMGFPKVGEGYYTHPNTGNQQHREFLLTHEQCIDLITGYRADVRIRINRRWQELEQANQTKLPQALPDFTNPAVAARAWAEQFEQREKAERNLAIAEPKAAALDRMSAADGDMTITNAAKVLKMRPSDLFAYLSQQKWIYKRNGVGGWIGYQDKVQSGYLTHGEYRYESKSTGVEKLVAQVYVTPKGLAKLAKDCVGE